MNNWIHLLPKVEAGFGAFFELIALALIPLVLVRRKDPPNTIAWILTLVFLPASGAILFLLFGRDRVRLPAKRKRQTNAVVDAEVIAAGASHVSQTAAFAAIPTTELEQQLFRASALLTHQAPTLGNCVDVLTEGNEVFDALERAFEQAEHHIHAEYYLIRKDATGDWFRDQLMRAARRGVRVRLLCDGFGCMMLGSRWAQPLRASGAHVRSFLPLRSVFLQPVNLRNHRKIVVIDGKVAFTGGVNIGDEYRGCMTPVGRWRDTHLRIEGPAAQALQRVFFQDWGFATKEVIADPAAYFPLLSEKIGDAMVAIVPSGPDTRTEAIHRLFFGAIAGARERLYINTPYFVPDQALMVALEFAAMRGVDVKIILPSHSNHKVTFHAGRSFYEPLLEAGVQIFEYEPGIIHAKTMVVDGKVCLVGSANMDMRSFRLNFEVHALLHDTRAAERLESSFFTDLSQSQRVELQAWKTRAMRLQILEGAARLVSPLL